MQSLNEYEQATDAAATDTAAPSTITNADTATTATATAAATMISATATTSTTCSVESLVSCAPSAMPMPFMAPTPVPVELVDGDATIPADAATTVAEATPVPLPGKPSALIRMALADLRKVEALPDLYRVNMDVWHREHRLDAVCEVCLAGSAISQSLGAKVGEHRGPEDFDQETTWKLYALNEFRVGNVFDGLCYLDRADLWLGADTRTITEYALSPEGFHRDMQKLASDFEAVGL